MMTNIIATLQKWVEINTHVENRQGQEAFLPLLEESFATLNGVIRKIPMPIYKKAHIQGVSEHAPGALFNVVKRPNAPFRILLGGHYDTVYPKDSAFQKMDEIRPNIYRGPGITDMKGGLLVMLESLKRFEKTPFAENVGWEVFINPDEEIGSPSSAEWIEEAAKRNHVGLVFEPSFADGALVDVRKGSMNLGIRVQGRSAHAGRDFQHGRNALYAIADYACQAENMMKTIQGSSINLGIIEGGHLANVVPDLGFAKINARADHAKDLLQLKKELYALADQIQAKRECLFEVIEESFRLPKEKTDGFRGLQDLFLKTAKSLGIDISFRASGGVSDGNILQGAGLPTLDTLGVVGGSIHTHEEYVDMNRFEERVLLTTQFMIALSQQGN